MSLISSALSRNPMVWERVISPMTSQETTFQPSAVDIEDKAAATRRHKDKLAEVYPVVHLGRFPSILPFNKFLLQPLLKVLNSSVHERLKLHQARYRIVLMQESLLTTMIGV